MQFLIILLFAVLVFALCFAALVFRGRRQGEAPRLHACGGHEEQCQCRKAHTPLCDAAGGAGRSRQSIDHTAP